ncbi:MAG: polyprenyl synthetase family protein [Candidatus Omnitrophica bacterium]|nr:polyprenyl synthetase family protein [Candidatus Omnitrophota bacterium]
MHKTLIPAINEALRNYVDQALHTYSLSKVDATISSAIREFVLRDGKRVRPVFFLLAYQGYSALKKIPGHAITAGLAFELLHDFLLIHDDIIDNSLTRRGKPTVHKTLEKLLRVPGKTGQDLAIVIGDIIYALAIESFLSIKADPALKEAALREFLRATILTGAGEYKDVLNGFKPLPKTTLTDINLNYRLKTAEYTFRAPMICGALLANAPKQDLARISDYALLLGEAFQINDDVIGIFGDSKKIGKSVISDIVEAKKTLPLYWAYKKTKPSERKFLVRSLGNQKLTFNDLLKIRRIIRDCGALAITQDTITSRLEQARRKLAQTRMHTHSKQLFSEAMHSFIACA